MTNTMPLARRSLKDRLPTLDELEAALRRKGGDDIAISGLIRRARQSCENPLIPVSNLYTFASQVGAYGVTQAAPPHLLAPSPPFGREHRDLLAELESESIPEPRIREFFWVLGFTRALRDTPRER